MSRVSSLVGRTNFNSVDWWGWWYALQASNARCFYWHQVIMQNNPVGHVPNLNPIAEFQDLPF